MMEKEDDEGEDYKPISVNDFIKSKIRAELEKIASGTIGYLSFQNKTEGFNYKY